MSNRMEYSLGFNDIGRLGRLSVSVDEHRAIERLSEFCGTADDVRTCAAMYDRERLVDLSAGLLALLAAP